MYDMDYHMVIGDAAGHTNDCRDSVTELRSRRQSIRPPAIAHARAQFDAMFTATDTFQSVDVPVRITGVGFSIISKDSQARRRTGLSCMRSSISLSIRPSPFLLHHNL